MNVLTTLVLADEACVKIDYIMISFCFFKQKKAFEMRIGDWSSDVCSSDLLQADALIEAFSNGIIKSVANDIGVLAIFPGADIVDQLVERVLVAIVGRDDQDLAAPDDEGHACLQQFLRIVVESELVEDRSEEHTSELQSLMRISYAVFCLKNKTKKTFRRCNEYRKTTKKAS